MYIHKDYMHIHTAGLTCKDESVKAGDSYTVAQAVHNAVVQGTIHIILIIDVHICSDNFLEHRTEVS